MQEKVAKKPSQCLQTSTSWLFAEKKNDAVLVPSPPQAKASSNGATTPSPAATNETSPQEPSFVDDDRAARHFSDEYEVIDTIGEGAVCNVYRVRSNSLKREFALKVLKDELISNSAAIKQFKKEVNAATDLTHANIAAVYGYGHTSAGAPFVVTHLCEGKNLAQAVREEGTFDAQRALNMFIQIADAMSHAHFKGVVHRDLKPSNVVISTDAEGRETARIIDFGMATVLQSARTAVADVTRTGEVFGSPHYMSPEQCRGEKVDERSDIYSLGCLMYEVINGNPPFAGLNLVQVIMRQLQEPAPLFDETKLGSAPMMQLQNIVLRCLEKDPALRYQHFEQVKVELQAVIAGDPMQASKLEVMAPIELRIVAAAIDGMILTVLIYLVGCLTDFTTSTEATHAFSQISDFLLAPVPEWIALRQSWMIASYAQLVDANDFLAGAYIFLAFFYHVLFEFSFLRGTPGKWATGLVVVDQCGERITIFRAIPRFLSKFLIIAIVLIERFCLPERALKSKITRPGIDSWSGTYIVKRKNCASFAIKGPQGYFNAQSISLEKVHRSLKKLNWWITIFATMTLMGIMSSLPFAIICFLAVVAALPYYLILQRRKKELLLDRRSDAIDARSWWTGLLRNTMDGKPRQ